MRSRHEKAAATTQTVATARASERRNGPCRVNSPRSPTGTEEGKGRGRSTRRTTRRSSGRTPPPTSPAHSTLRLTTTTVCQRSRAPSLTTSTRSGRRSGFCSTSWSRLETSLLGCLLSMLLCRRWWTSWRMCCRSLISSSLSRRSKSPRSPAFPVLLLVGFFLCRRRQNSWRTCHGWSGCGLHSAPTPLAGCGPACGCRPRGSTGSWRALGITREPARQGSPPAQGGILILGKAEAAAPPVVSVTVQLKFQQSIVEFFKVPQLQFFDRVVATTVALQRQGSQCKLYRRPEISRCRFLDGRRHARWCANDRIWSDTAEKLWFRSCILLTSGRCHCCCSSSTRCGRPCDLAATCLAVGASDSAHRRSQRTIQLQQRRIRFQRGWRR